MDLLLNRVYFLLFIAVFFSGCVAVTGHGDSLQTFEKELKNSTCNYSFVEEKIEDKDDVILWASQGGSLARNCFDYQKSNLYFDKVEELYKSNVDLQSNVSRTGESASTILVNNNVNDYKGNVYETVMLNTYKGLNFMAIDDFDNARVEFNRALDRQRRAKEYFNSEIKKEKQKNQKDKNYNKAQNRYTQKAIYDVYKDTFDGFELYPDFVNPFTTYLSGIFFFLDGDYEKARHLLKESMSMQPNNKQIKSDFELIKNPKKNKNYAWIIYEAGESMARREIRINIPLFIFTNKVYYTGIALPKLYSRDSSYKYIQVNNQQSTVVSDMDKIINTEFEKRFSQVALEATMNLIAKTYIQYELNKSGSLGGIAGMFYQSLTNRTDVRSWTALPENFQSMRVELNENLVIIKDDKKNVISTVEVEKDRNVLIYIKSSSKGSIKVHKIIKGKK